MNCQITLPSAMDGIIFAEETVSYAGGEYLKRTGEFWTAQQRQMHSLHYAISYRASFKPELPHYFIRKYSEPGDIVMDPFLGRGTTVLEANLLGRVGYGNDVNPLSERIAYPKTHPVELSQIESILNSLNLGKKRELDQDLSMFYHPDTHREILNLRDYLQEDRSDAARFIEMVALSRLHGHSEGFFSVYSFPQISVPKSNQIKINERRKQVPEYRAIAPRILRKAKKILRDADVKKIRAIGEKNLFTTRDARQICDMPSECASLIVTSPPFLNKADYIMDNWLEMWFLGIDIEQVRRDVIQTANLEEWTAFLEECLKEMARILRVGGICVVEVGEIKYKREIVHLDEVVVSLAPSAGLRVKEVLIHQQRFTKLANTFKIENNKQGTNTHRLVVMKK